MSLRVLLITQWFDPEPTFKGLLFAKKLQEQGFKVEVLTGFPNYPGGKIYPGYRISWRKKEVIEGVPVNRVAIYPNHGQSAIKRILNYVSFAISSCLFGLWMARHTDIIYAYHPPLTVGLSAGIIRLFFPIKLVYDIQDLWPDSLRATGMIQSKLALSIVAAICQWVYQRADEIVVLSPGFKQLLQKRGVLEKKIHIIYNWADEDALINSSGKIPINFPGTDRFRILFAGNIGKAQALDAILDAAALLQDKNSQACFILVGGGVEVLRLKERTQEMKLHNVLFFSAVPMAEIGSLLSSADVLLVHLRKDPLFKITIPSKTQAYMAVGKPLLMAVDGDAADLVKLSGGGVVAESESPDSIVQAVQFLENQDKELLHQMGQNAQRYYKKYLSLDSGVHKFAEIFRR